MRADEVNLIRAWADDLGWNPGSQDGPAFLAQDPEGFFVGELAGEPIACISCVRYDDRFGFLGQFIVRPKYMGQGYGLTIGRAGQAHLTGRCIGLDGVLDKMNTYQRIGYRFSHYHVRFSGTGGGDRPAGLINLTDVPFEQVADYDARCFPARRTTFLREWLRIPGSTAFGCLANGDLSGVGVIRPSSLGFKIGPLFADDADTASRLLAGLAAAVPGRPYCLDMPEPGVQSGTADLVRRYGLTEVFRTARMYTTDPPEHAREKVFGITSLELG
jgi:hypothetical protein